MASRELDVDPDGVRTAGAQARAAASTAAVTDFAVSPCAADATSVRVASRLNHRIAALNMLARAADMHTMAASARLHSNADTYEDEDAVSASDLGGSRGVPLAPSPAAPVPATVVGPSAAPAAPSGVIPTVGRQIAEVIHAGLGPEGLHAAATELDSRAAQLDLAADTVRTARSQTEGSWQSAAADRAVSRLQTLESDYVAHATQARSLSRHARVHAESFTRARTQIPTPEEFADVENRLLAAYAANAHESSLGRYSETVTRWQLALAAMNRDAVNSYDRYRRDAEADVIDPGPDDEPAEGAAPATSEAGRRGEVPGPKAGQGTQTVNPGSLVEPAALGGEALTGMLQTVLPAVLGGVSGAAGGMLGAFSGAGEQLQQAGTQLTSGLAQGASAAMAPAIGAPEGGGGAGDPAGGGERPAAEDTEPDLDAGGGGGTEPASAAGVPAAPGPLSAPMTAAAPATTPATFSTAPAVTAGGGGGGAAMGAGMMPPMMPMAGRGGGGAGDEDRRLYPQRRLRVEAPPNSEPVKGRREPRAQRSKDAEGEDDQ